MLSKIFNFSNRKSDKKTLSEDVSDCQLLSTNVGFYPDLDISQIRVLVFKDCDRKGKTLLYDSKVVAKLEERSQVSSTSKQNDKTPSKTICGKSDSQEAKHGSNGKRKSPLRRPSGDSTMLGEMIFGSVAMTYRGSTVKVHVIRSPHQLLMTKVFNLRPRLSVSSSCSDTSESLTSSQVDSLLESSRIESDAVSLSSQNNSPKEFQLKEGASTPVAVPGIVPTVNIDHEDDSGLTASLESLYLTPCSGSMTSCYNLASSPCGNLQRRLHRSQVKSIDGRYSRKQHDEPSEEHISPILRRQPKIGLGILFPLSNNEEKSSALQGFFFAHFPLFDSHVHRLRCAVEKACYSKNSFSTQVLEAIDRFCEDVCNLLKTPRLKEPVWLTMMSFPDHRRVVCEQFMEQFTSCLNLYNNRESSFFLSSLLSAVLTHHLAWVPTVMPAGAAPNRAYLDKHSSETLDLLAQSHPYNPLWAQLSDLYGAIGYPLKLARTVITGKNSKLVGHLLNIISYFIRCTEVTEHNLERIETLEESGEMNLETTLDCCLCSQDTGSLPDCSHKHRMCESCIENSGLSICENCQKLLPKELNESTLKSKDLSREVLRGLPCCDKCGLLQKESTANELLRLNTMSGSCSCLPKWAVAKELKHFLNGVSLTERSETFRCYCCDVDKSDNDTKSTFQCYCIGDDKCSHCSTSKNGIIDNAHSFFDSINGQCSDQNLENIFMELLSQDQFCPKLECSCAAKDDAASLEIDLESSQDNVEKMDIESNDSYCRSGSLDSGFHQSSSSSSCTKGKIELECLSVDTLEDDGDDEFGPEELPLPGIHNILDEQDVKSEKWKKSNNFGRSLFAGVSDVYHPDFVLQGVTGNKQDFLPSLTNDLCLALRHSVIDDVLSDAVCIVADTDNWTCELISAKRGKIRSSSDSTQTQPIEVSNLVLSMLSSVIGLWDVKMPAEFCLMHLEDRLKEIYLKSRVIAEWLHNSKKPISRYELAHTLGIDDSDIMLLLAVASSHSPQGMTYLR